MDMLLHIDFELLSTIKPPQLILFIPEASFVEDTLNWIYLFSTSNLDHDQGITKIK